jgi:hypothetical protein
MGRLIRVIDDLSMAGSGDRPAETGTDLTDPERDGRAGGQHPGRDGNAQNQGTAVKDMRSGTDDGRILLDI